jgi:hypothetical protein
MNAAAATLSSKEPRAVAGWAQAVELLSRPLTDDEALPLLDSALRAIRAAFNDLNASAPNPQDPNRMHPLLIAEAAVLISRSRRATSLGERIEELKRAQDDLETISEIYRSELAWMLLAVCHTERATAQLATRPASLEDAKMSGDHIYKRNPNAAHALRLKAVILLRSAENAPWKEADALLEQAQDLLERSRSLDPTDYFAAVTSADVLKELAERRTRDKARELVATAKLQYADAAKLDPVWPNAFIGLGWADLLLARRASGAAALTSADAAMMDADEALKRRRDSVRALRLKGISRHRAARGAPRESAETLFEEAFKYFDEGNKLHPEDYFLLTDWAFAHLAQARRRVGADAGKPLDLAEQKAQEALKLEPLYPHAHVALGDINRRRAQLAPDQARRYLDAAREFYKSALKVSPDLDGALTGSAILAGRISELAPREQRGEGLAEAEQRLRHTLELRADNEDALEALGDVLSRQARDRDDYAAAIHSAREAYDQAWKIDPQLDHSQLRVAEIDLELAQINNDAKLMTETIEAFRAAARALPERARAHSGLGEALAQSVISRLSTADPVRALEESVAEFQHAASLDRRNATVHRGWRRTVDELAKAQVEKKDEHLKEVARLDGIIASLMVPKVA